ncbi:uncharacterized protein LOC142523949 [Primulina tabacum]|uniref:uncharacterized protein LOC142523949 n=1 Tax=Primulina tabacum TaxID=48773 RepID=UPI003F599E06
MNSHFQFHASSSSSSSLSDNEDETPINWMDDFENLDNARNAILNILGTRSTVGCYLHYPPRARSHTRRYNEAMFRRRFRMSRNLFLRIVDEVKNHDIYFTQRSDSVGRLGLSTIQKTTAALRILAYALPADATDEYIKIGESTAIQCMQRFFRVVMEIFAERYLRSPTANDVARLLYIGKERGFPGMLGSLDCMLWKWKNCPTAWAGQYVGRSGSPTIILEAVADYDLWI